MTNLPFLWQILTPKNKSESTFSCSTMKFTFWCLQDIYLQNKSAFKLKIMESLLIAHDKLILNKANSSLPLQLFQFNIIGYYTMFYTSWCPSIPLCIHNSSLFDLFNFHYYVKSFVFYQKPECKSIYYNFRRDQKSSSFWKLARNKWICQ